MISEQNVRGTSKNQKSKKQSGHTQKAEGESLQGNSRKRNTEEHNNLVKDMRKLEGSYTQGGDDNWSQVWHMCRQGRHVKQKTKTQGLDTN